ncbi:MAG: AMP-binding protein, partial [Pseudomonadota bacterium]
MADDAARAGAAGESGSGDAQRAHVGGGDPRTERWYLATMADKAAVEAIPAAERWEPQSPHAMLMETAARFPDRPAVSFQLKGGAKDSAETWDFRTLAAEVNRAANLFRRHGIGDDDAIAYLLPNCNETVLALLGGLTAGRVCPVNPLLEAPQIAAILRENGAKAVVTLKALPKIDIAQKVHAALADVPEVTVVFEVDLKRYLSPPLSWLVPLLRPKVEI